MKRTTFLTLFGLLLGPMVGPRAAAAPAAAGGPDPSTSLRVNILVILADDLGYGDVQCYNPTRGKIATPNLDRLAAQGMRFTDGHSSSGVCSPSRYTLLTGRYHWRTGKAGIVGQYGPPMIAADRLTVPALLKQHRYRTAAIGKWHLGWNWPRSGGRTTDDGGRPKTDRGPRPEIDYSLPIADGPTTRGFDSYFGTDVPNWPPFCFIENDRTVGLPGAPLPKGLVGNHLASINGPALPGWQLEEILPTLGDRACAYIADAATRPEPFFLYLPLTAPHTPLAVTPEWKGKSGLVPYADFVMQTDALVGRVLEALDRSGASSNTLVWFTSDNGCAPYVGAETMEERGHFPSGPWRGYKSDAWEGGHRVPFIVRWPGQVKPGGQCDQLVHQADLLATCADLLQAHLPAQAGEDSVSILPLLRGGDAPVHAHAVSQSSGGLLALRKGSWKMVFGKGSGGWGKGSVQTPGQLYNLADDPGETNNLYTAKPELVAELTDLMEQIITRGRSTPGAPQGNDVPVKDQFLPTRKP